MNRIVQADIVVASTPTKNQIKLSPQDFYKTLPLKDNVSKQIKTRINRFNAWLVDSGKNLFNMTLSEYRDSLIEEGLSNKTILAYLSTIRSEYERVIENREMLYRYADANLPDGTSMADRKAFVDEVVHRINRALNPKNSKVDIIHEQDMADDKHIRLTEDEIFHLLMSPDVNTITGIRDRAIMALALASGCRVSELVSATIDDVFSKYGNSPAFRVLRGKGKKQRFIPYGGLVELIDFVDHWLNVANIQSGAVFRRVFKNDKIGCNPLTTYSIELILSKYTFMRDGNLLNPTPHDLRRTYALHNYLNGMAITEIQQNLGHADQKTTLEYIGILSAELRAPQHMYGLNKPE